MGILSCIPVTISKTLSRHKFVYILVLSFLGVVGAGAVPGRIACLSVEGNHNEGAHPSAFLAKGWDFQLPILTILTRRSEAEAAPKPQLRKSNAKSSSARTWPCW